MTYLCKDLFVTLEKNSSTAICSGILDISLIFPLPLTNFYGFIFQLFTFQILSKIINESHHFSIFFYFSHYFYSVISFLYIKINESHNSTHFSSSFPIIYTYLLISVPKLYINKIRRNRVSILYISPSSHGGSYLVHFIRPQISVYLMHNFFFCILLAYLANFPEIWFSKS